MAAFSLFALLWYTLYTIEHGVKSASLGYFVKAAIIQAATSTYFIPKSLNRIIGKSRKVAQLLGKEKKIISKNNNIVESVKQIEVDNTEKVSMKTRKKLILKYNN